MSPQDSFSLIKLMTLVFDLDFCHAVNQEYFNLDTAPYEFGVANLPYHSCLTSDLLKAEDKMYGSNGRPEHLGNKPLLSHHSTARIPQHYCPSTAAATCIVCQQFCSRSAFTTIF